MSYPCPCCGYLVFESSPGSYDICPICFWEDCLSQLRFVTTDGANHVSLVEAQQNFLKLGVSEPRLKEFVRAPNAEDRRDQAWRLFDEQIDHVEIPVSGRDYGRTYAKDMCDYYYWRNVHPGRARLDEQLVSKSMGRAILYRPVGPAELALVLASGSKRFPLRLPEQPIFYPVENEEYACQIARDWNVKSDGQGHVLRFVVDAAFLERYPVQQVGNASHQERWIPAEDLEQFNDHIVGEIEVIASYLR